MGRAGKVFGSVAAITKRLPTFSEHNAGLYRVNRPPLPVRGFIVQYSFSCNYREPLIANYSRGQSVKLTIIDISAILFYGRCAAVIDCSDIHGTVLKCIYSINTCIYTVGHKKRAPKSLYAYRLCSKCPPSACTQANRRRRH